MSHRRNEGARQAQALVRHKTPWLLLLVLIALAAFSIQLAAAKTSGNLPGGSSIEVDNTSPADGAQLLIPIGDTTLDILDEGTASVGAGVVIKDTTVVYVLDQSGSMTLGAGVDCTGDAVNDTRDTCAQEGIAGANDAAADPFSAVGLTGIASYATAGASHDVDLGAGGTQLLVAPDHDGDLNSVPDLEDVARTLDGLLGQQTNYAAGLTEAFAIINDASNTGAVNIILFLSDADSSSIMVGANVNTLAGSVPANTTIHAFGIGVGPSCTFDGGTGTLNDVAALSTAGTGTCQVVADVTQIANQITSAIGTTLISLEIQVDGGPFTPIPAGDIDIALPANGTFAPKTANYSTPVNDLGPGSHTICVRATGSDAGGTGIVTDCKTIGLIVEVEIDIKPGSDPNSINCNNPNEVITVAILTTDDFDATTVDHTTVTFEGASETHTHPKTGEPLRHEEDVDGDGDIDLVFHFLQGDTDLTCESEEGVLMGETFDGDPVQGTDAVRMIDAGGGQP
jgi:hypothetical protein